MWTLQQFEKVYDHYQASGLRVKEFCRNESIVESRFYYWQKRLREHNYRTGRESGFIPIVFTGSNPSPANKEVVHHKPIPEHVDPPFRFMFTHHSGDVDPPPFFNFKHFWFDYSGMLTHR